jgi:D-serine deaminase-like pyridoxal phosphate-dependent protein
MHIHDLQTPALLLDPGRLQANAARMRERAADLGVALRPHMKTAKCHEIAKVAHGGQLGPITVATLREAEYFAAHGWTDMLYAVCIAPQKLDRVAAIAARGAQLTVIVDSMEAALAVVRHPGTHTAMVEIDCGEDRTGVAPGAASLTEIGRCLSAGPRCTFKGVLTHGGHSYSERGPEALARVAEQERAAAVRAADRLREAGIACPCVSVGSTPTATHAEHLDGVTEMRPGVYLLGDLFQAGIGSCTEADIAATVLATVISHRRSSNRIIVDAGGLALSKDRSTAGSPFDAGYGRVLDAQTGAPLGDLHIASVHQEHGEITSAAPMQWDALPLGAMVRILPNHICMTAAMYERYHLIGAHGQVTDTWARTNGWAPSGG